MLRSVSAGGGETGGIGTLVKDGSSVCGKIIKIKVLFLIGCRVPIRLQRIFGWVLHAWSSGDGRGKQPMGDRRFEDSHSQAQSGLALAPFQASA